VSKVFVAVGTNYPTLAAPSPGSWGHLMLLVNATRFRQTAAELTRLSPDEIDRVELRAIMTLSPRH
jgi:hypothetical protein